MVNCVKTAEMSSLIRRDLKPQQQHRGERHRQDRRGVTVPIMERMQTVVGLS